jgi:elongation factor G
MSDFLEGKEIPLDVLKKQLRKGVIANKIFPVLTGSSLKNKGVQLVLDAVVDYLPSPLDCRQPGTNTDTGEEETRPASDEAPFAALVFKLQLIHSSARSFFRVYSGSFESGRHRLQFRQQ